MEKKCHIPIISKGQIDEIDRYFGSIKPWFPLPQEEHQKWKMIKKAVPILHKKGWDNESLWAEITIDSLENIGVSFEILVEMRTYERSF